MSDQQTKCGFEKKTIVSLILGVITTILTFPLILIFFLYTVLYNILSPSTIKKMELLLGKLDYPSTLVALMSLFLIIIGIIGLILGIKDLKSAKKLSLAGIVLNSIGLGGAIYLFFPYGLGLCLELIRRLIGLFITD